MERKLNLSVKMKFKETLFACASAQTRIFAIKIKKKSGIII